MVCPIVIYPVWKILTCVFRICKQTNWKQLVRNCDFASLKGYEIKGFIMPEVKPFRSFLQSPSATGWQTCFFKIYLIGNSYNML